MWQPSFPQTDPAHRLRGDGALIDAEGVLADRVGNAHTHTLSHTLSHTHTADTHHITHAHTHT